MRVKGLDGMTLSDLGLQLQAGGKFVVFDYCVSLLVVTFKRSSAVHFVRPGESSVVKGLGYTLLTALVGWWGIPWGIVYSSRCLVTNLRGGRDVTAEMVAALTRAGAS